ncbi:MAG: CPBP family intramembrane glutamic endopeptidase [Anaerolineales bacterium]
MKEINSSASSRPFSLGLYLLVVFGLSWPFQIAGAAWAADNALALFLLNSASMVMVTVGTFLAGRYIFRDGFAGAGWRWGKPRHYLAVAGLIALLWVFPTLVRLGIGTVQWSDVDGTQIVWLLVLPIVMLIPGFGEEFGWRGYLLPHLARRLGARQAVAVHAVIWWAWHLPVVAGAGIRAGAAEAAATGGPVVLSAIVSAVVVVLLGAVPTILHAVIFAYFWARSRSLAVATVYHAAYDGVRDSIARIAGLPGMVGVWSNLVLTVLGVILLWKGDWKNLAAAADPQSPGSERI